MAATYHLHCLGHRVKYGNPEVENATQQFLSTTRPYCSIEFIKSFLFLVILVTYNIGICICIYRLAKGVLKISSSSQSHLMNLIYLIDC